jgi:hypothetical protein
MYHVPSLIFRGDCISEKNKGDKHMNMEYSSKNKQKSSYAGSK